MTVKEYYCEVIQMVNDIINLSGLEISTIEEQEKQVLGAYCFGVINGYSLEKKMNAIQIQGAVIDALIQKFCYSPATAAQFCDFLIKSTDKQFHPSMNAIIHRGLEGYYQLKEGRKEEIQQNIADIIQTVKRYSEV
jgi:hypothetical protein